MKKIVFSIFILVSLLFYKPVSIQAQGLPPVNTFSCGVAGGLCWTSASQSNCTNGFRATFPNGSFCEDITDLNTCRTQTGPFPCQPINPTPTPVTLPQCVPSGCYPQLCPTGQAQNNAATCASRGPDYVCCFPSQQDCYNNCLSTGGTPSECRVSCPIATPPSGGGGGGTTTGGGGMINLNAIIDSMGSTKFSSNTTLGDIISVALPFLYTLAGIGLLLYLIAGGFRYLTSQGDPKKLEGAKSAIYMAIVGFLIVITAFFITQIMNSVFKLGAGV